MKNQQKRPYTVTKSETAWSSPWYKVRRDQIELPDGRTGEYNVVEKEPAVVVVPMTEMDEVVMINIYRHTTDRWSWEVPAGSVKPTQTPELAAIEELHEEIGGTADNLILLGQFYTMNGISNELCYYYLATNITLGDMHHEPLEIMTRHIRPWPDVLKMIQNGEIKDSLTALALTLTDQHFKF